MNEQGIAMSDERWEALTDKVKFSLECIKRYDGYITEDEINLIVSVLKSNIPFNVVGEN